jgi:hypothetical protein
MVDMSGGLEGVAAIVLRKHALGGIRALLHLFAFGRRSLEPSVLNGAGRVAP